MTADYVIVGGGSAGCVLADRLSEDGRHEVVLLEAGGTDRHPLVQIPAAFLFLIDDPRFSWRYRSEPLGNGRRLGYPQGRVLGGTGSINGMLYVRSQPSEHDLWVAQGCRGWSYDEVLPFYKRAERAAAGDGNPLAVEPMLETHALSEAFLQAAEQNGLARLSSLNGGQRHGAAAFHQLRLGRFRGGAAQTYLRRARHRPNLRIVTKALCERIVFEGSRATGVTFRAGAESRDVMAAREVIVSCGAIRSPQLLELSGIGAPARLAALGLPVVADLPGVGRNLRDHYSVRFSRRVGGTVSLNERTRGTRLATELLRYALTGRGLLTLGASTAAAFARSAPDRAGPDLQLSFAPGSFEPGTYELEREGGMTIAVYHSYPDSAGEVHAASASAHDAPSIRPGYLQTDGDRVALLAGMHLARRLFASPAFAPWRRQETLPGSSVASDDALLDYAREKGVSGYHLVGTCRMGTDGDAVVDPELRVHGTTGLRVVDASIMPSCPSGNTNAPTMMIAERCAAMILAG